MFGLGVSGPPWWPLTSLSSQIRCMLNIWGVILYLRLPWITAQAGIGECVYCASSLPRPHRSSPELGLQRPRVLTATEVGVVRQRSTEQGVSGPEDALWLCLPSVSS